MKNRGVICLAHRGNIYQMCKRLQNIIKKHSLLDKCRTSCDGSQSELAGGELHACFKERGTLQDHRRLSLMLHAGSLKTLCWRTTENYGLVLSGRNTSCFLQGWGKPFLLPGLWVWAVSLLPVTSQLFSPLGIPEDYLLLFHPQLQCFFCAWENAHSRKLSRP